MNAGTILIQINVQNANFNKSMDQVEKRIDDVSKTGSNSFDTLQKRSGISLSLISVAAATAFNSIKNTISSSISTAINRVDTLSNSSRVFANMGFSSETTSAAIKALTKSIEGLPTPLDSAIKGMQNIAATTGNVGKSQKIFTALNDAILGFGGTADMVDNSIVQLGQAFSNGKVDGQTWISMMNSGMGPALNAIAKKMGVTTGELKKGLSDGAISVEIFQDALISLDENGGGGLASLSQIAFDSTSGIGTSFANAATAVSRGVADIISAIGGENLSNSIKASGARFEFFLGKIADVINYIKGNQGAMDAFKVSIEALGLAAGGAAIKLAVLNGIKISNNIFSSINNSIGSLQTNLVKMALATRGAGSSASGLSKVFSFLAKNPFILIIGTIITVLTALFLKTETGQKVLQKLGEIMSNVFASIQPVIENVFNTISGVMGKILPIITGVFENVAPIIGGVFSDLVTNVGPAAAQVFGVLASTFAQIAPVLGEIITQFAQIVQQLFPALVPLIQSISNLFLTLVQSAIQIGSALIEALIPLIPVFVNIVKLVAQIVVQIAQALIPVVMAIVKMIVDLIPTVIPIIKLIIGAIAQIIQAIMPIIELILGVIAAILPPIISIVSIIISVITQIIQAIMPVITFIAGIIAQIIQIIVPIIVFIVNLVMGIITTIINIITGIISFITGVINTIINIVGGIIGVISGIINSVVKFFSDGFTGISNFVKGVIDGIIGFFKSIPDFVKGIVDKVVGFFSGIGKTIGDFVGGAFKGVINGALGLLEGFLNTPINLINGAIDLINKLPGVNIGKIPKIELPRMATGGIIDTTTMAIIGESGREVVMPLENNTGWIDQLAADIVSRGGVNAQNQVVAGETQITQNYEIRNDVDMDRANRDLFRKLRLANG